MQSKVRYKQSLRERLLKQREQIEIDDKWRVLSSAEETCGSAIGKEWNGGRKTFNK